MGELAALQSSVLAQCFSSFSVFRQLVATEYVQLEEALKDCFLWDIFDNKPLRMDSIVSEKILVLLGPLFISLRSFPPPPPSFYH